MQHKQSLHSGESKVTLTSRKGMGELARALQEGRGAMHTMHCRLASSEGASGGADRLTALVWVPGHAGIPSNECTRGLVRELLYRTTEDAGGKSIPLEPDSPWRHSNHRTPLPSNNTGPCCGDHSEQILVTRVVARVHYALVNMHSRVLLLAVVPFHKVLLCPLKQYPKMPRIRTHLAWSCLNAAATSAVLQ